MAQLFACNYGILEILYYYLLFELVGLIELRDRRVPVLNPSGALHYLYIYIYIYILPPLGGGV